MNPKYLVLYLFLIPGMVFSLVSLFTGFYWIVLIASFFVGLLFFIKNLKISVKSIMPTSIASPTTSQKTKKNETIEVNTIWIIPVVFFIALVGMSIYFGYINFGDNNGGGTYPKVPDIKVKKDGEGPGSYVCESGTNTCIFTNPGSKNNATFYIVYNSDDPAISFQYSGRGIVDINLHLTNIYGAYGYAPKFVFFHHIVIRQRGEYYAEYKNGKIYAITKIAGETKEIDNKIKSSFRGKAPYEIKLIIIVPPEQEMSIGNIRFGGENNIEASE